MIGEKFGNVNRLGRDFRFRFIEIPAMCVGVPNKAETERLREGWMIRVLDVIVCIHILIFFLSLFRINKSFWLWHPQRMQSGEIWRRHEKRPDLLIRSSVKLKALLEMII